MKIEVYADAVCPWCFIGKRRLERARALRPAAAVEIVWRPFQLNPWMPPEGMSRAEYLTAKFGAADAGRLYDGVRQAGQAEGVAFDFDRIERTPSTVDAHRMVAWAGRARPGGQDAMMTALFEAYFLEGQDISDAGVLSDVAARLGHDRGAAARYLATDDDRDAVRAADAKARQLGVQGVPCFIIDGRYAVSGAQEPEYFMPLFDLALAEPARG